MKLEFPNRMVKVRAQDLADAIEVIRDLADLLDLDPLEVAISYSEAVQSKSAAELAALTERVRQSKSAELATLWDRLSKAIEDVTGEEADDDV